MSELLYCPWCEMLSGKMSKNGYCQKCFEAKLICFIEQSELTDLKAKYQKAVEALKFYGDSNNWGCDEGWDGYLVSGVISINDQESIGTSASFEYGGKLARQTLAELGEKE